VPAGTGVVGVVGVVVVVVVVVVVIVNLLSTAGDEGSLGVKPTKWTRDDDRAHSRCLQLADNLDDFDFALQIHRTRHYDVLYQKSDSVYRCVFT